MNKSVIMGFGVITIALFLIFYGSVNGWFYTYQDYEEDHNLRDSDLYSDVLDELLSSAGNLGYLPEDNELVIEHREQVDNLFGETWHSDNYNKDEIEVPEVEAEETVEGELWFPAINNTAPLDEIAPTISYELMLDGYKISPYYPQNPEDYTAQALNENAFPIGFFRKINDLCYYTACKVEGGGYIYYFFCANGNVDYEEAMAEAGKKLNYDANGNLLVEESVHLFNADVADISSMDLTKEVVWRGSVYAADVLGTCKEFIDVIEKCYKSDNWFEKTPYSLSENISSSFNPLSELQDKWAKNCFNVSTASKENQFSSLQKVNENGQIMQTYYMCSDGYDYTFFHVVPTINNGSISADVNGIEEASTLQLSGFGIVSNNIVFHYYGVYGGIKEQAKEYNSFSIEILPQDNIHNLK